MLRKTADVDWSENACLEDAKAWFPSSGMHMHSRMLMRSRMLTCKGFSDWLPDEDWDSAILTNFPGMFHSWNVTGPTSSWGGTPPASPPSVDGPVLGNCRTF